MTHMLQGEAEQGGSVHCVPNMYRFVIKSMGVWSNYFSVKSSDGVFFCHSITALSDIKHDFNVCMAPVRNGCAISVSRSHFKNASLHFCVCLPEGLCMCVFMCVSYAQLCRSYFSKDGMTCVMFMFLHACVMLIDRILHNMCMLMVRLCIDQCI